MIRKKESEWRQRARDAITQAIAEAQRRGLEWPEVVRFVSRHGYPFGERRYWPYKIWLSECRRQLKGEKPKYGRRPVRPAPGQGTLF